MGDTVWYRKVRISFSSTVEIKMVKIINVLGLALVGAAMASEIPSRKQLKGVFNKIDSNGDRLVDADEWQAAQSQLADDSANFGDADSNGDGSLNFNEFYKAVDNDENRFVCGGSCVFGVTAVGAWWSG